MIQDPKVPQSTVSLKMPTTTQKFLAAKAAERGVSVSFLIRKMIVEYARDPRNVNSHCPAVSLAWTGVEESRPEDMTI